MAGGRTPLCGASPRADGIVFTDRLDGHPPAPPAHAVRFRRNAPARDGTDHPCRRLRGCLLSLTPRRTLGCMQPVLIGIRWYSVYGGVRSRVADRLRSKPNTPAPRSRNSSAAEL